MKSKLSFICKEFHVILLWLLHLKSSHTRVDQGQSLAENWDDPGYKQFKY